jgi:hypothetical protein
MRMLANKPLEPARAAAALAANGQGRWVAEVGDARS